jgi:hypothetical protein
LARLGRGGWATTTPQKRARTRGALLPPSVVAGATANDAQSVGPRLNELVVDLAFSPAGYQHARLDAARDWALPGARARAEYELPDARGRWLVPADATVSFSARAETATQPGQVCSTRAGEALFLLSDLLATTPSTADSVRAEWQTTGDVPLAKGFVDVRYAQLVQHLPSGEAVPVDAERFFRFAPASSDAALVFHAYDAQERARTLAAETASYLGERVNASLDVFFGANAPLAVSEPASLRRMHCPYFNTSSGLLWGSTYALRVARAPPPAAYFDAALRLALVRNDARAEHVLAAVRAQAAAPATPLASSRFSAKLLVETLTVFANSMVYLDDFTNEGGRTYLAALDSTAAASPDASTRHRAQAVRLVRRGALASTGALGSRAPVNVVEDYKTARLGHGDDCEGVAKEIYMAFWDLRRTDVSAASPLLQELAALARSNVYTPALVLAAVTNKNLDTAEHELSDEEALAHTFTAFIRTDRFLERLRDGNDSEFGGLSARVRASTYARDYTPAPWHAGLDDVLVGEGTARSSAFVRPTTEYYANADEHARVVDGARARVAATQSLLAAGLPTNVVAVEIPNANFADADGALARDERDVSGFYKAVSAMYVSAFRDSGILDFAFARTSDATASGLTHGLRFTRFSQPRWDEATRLVPHNALSERDGALADATLAQLEPIPTLRRRADVASAREHLGPPASLRALEALFDGAAEATGAATAHLLTEPERMPEPPHSITLTVRAEDLTDEAARALVAAVSAERARFAGARVTTTYLADVPVRGDESSLEPVVLHEIELRLATASGASIRAHTKPSAPPRRIALAAVEPVYYNDIVRARFGGDFRVTTTPVFNDDVRARIGAFIARANRTRGAWRRATIVDASGVERVDDTRTSESVALDDATLATAIRRDVAQRVFGDVRLAAALCAGNDALLQLQRYPSPGGRFDLHHDSIVYDDDDDAAAFPTDEPTVGTRLLTAFVYLNDGEFEGGTTEFPFYDNGTRIEPRAYTAAAWPNYTRTDAGSYVPDRRALHRANAIRARKPGVVAYKYGMNVWFCLTPGALELESSRKRRVLDAAPRAVGAAPVVSGVLPQYAAVDVLVEAILRFDAAAPFYEHVVEDDNAAGYTIVREFDVETMRANTELASLFETLDDAGDVDLSYAMYSPGAGDAAGENALEQDAPFFVFAFADRLLSNRAMRRDGIAFAARVGATGSVQTIVEGRARNLFTQTQLETAFITGAGAGHLPFVRFMLESDDVAVRAAAAENGALLAAAINGRLPVVRYLLDGGFDDVTIAANGYAVVYDALARRRRDVFLYLIARRDFPLLELEAELRRLGASVYTSDFDAIVAARRKQ